MPTTKTNYTPHRKYVSAYFGGDPADYKTTVLRGVPGLRVLHPQQGIFQVETQDQRIAVCQACLFDVYSALEVHVDVAALALDDTPPTPALVEQVLALLEQRGFVQDHRAARKMVMVYTALGEGSGKDSWRGIGLLNPWWPAAALILLERAGQPGVLARQLADLYFMYPELLSVVSGGRFGRASLAELQMALYQVDWGPEGKPVPKPVAEGREPETTPTGPVPKRAARRKNNTP